VDGPIGIHLFTDAVEPHIGTTDAVRMKHNTVRFTPPGSDVKVVWEVDYSTPESLAVVIVRDHGPDIMLAEDDFYLNE